MALFALYTCIDTIINNCRSLLTSKRGRWKQLLRYIWAIQCYFLLRL